MAPKPKPKLAGFIFVRDGGDVYNGAPKMSAMNFHVGDRVEDKKTHERGRVTFIYSTLEFRDEFIAVLFNGHDEALAVPADSVRKVATTQS